MGNYFRENKHNLFKKYNTNELMQDLQSVSNGGEGFKILNHFLLEVMAKAKPSRYKITPYEFLQNDALINKALDFAKTKPEFYKDLPDDRIIWAYIRNSGRETGKVANFRVSVAKNIYNKYLNSNNSYNIYDISCGWGSRMLASSVLGHNYYGTDPNTELCSKLNEMGDFLEYCGLPKPKVFCCGSEVLINELIGNIDLVFTSPPYFDLEIYCDESTQSIHGKSYEEWIESWYLKTVYNCTKYLKSGGKFIINIKNVRNSYPHYDIMKSITNRFKTLKFIEDIPITVGTEKVYHMNTNYDEDSYSLTESAFVFEKI